MGAPPTETPAPFFDPDQGPLLEKLTQIVNTRRHKIEKVQDLILLDFVFISRCVLVYVYESEYVCVCLCLRACICVYVCVRICVCVCICICVGILMHPFMYLCLYVSPLIPIAVQDVADEDDRDVSESLAGREAAEAARSAGEAKGAAGREAGAPREAPASEEDPPQASQRTPYHSSEVPEAVAVALPVAVSIQMKLAVVVE